MNNLNYNYQQKTPSCVANAYKYAKDQGTFYDEKSNTMLYGISNNLKVTGVSDGTCNQINPIMLKYENRCGAGAAGANPCYADNNQYIEPFCDTQNGCNINHFIAILLLILILILFVSMNVMEYNEINSIN